MKMHRRDVSHFPYLHGYVCHFVEGGVTFVVLKRSIRFVWEYDKYLVVMQIMADGSNPQEPMPAIQESTGASHSP